MIDQVLKFLDYLTRSNNYAIKAMIAIIVLVVIFSSNRGAFEKIGKTAGILASVLVAFLKWPAKILLGFLLFCVLFVTLVPSEARAAGRSRVIEVGILFICALIAPGDGSCAPALMYGDADVMEPSRSAPELDGRSGPALATADKPQRPPSASNEQAGSLLPLPTDILPPEPERTREDVEQFSEIFGLPKTSDAQVAEEGSPVGLPAELLPEAAQVAAEG